MAEPARSGDRDARTHAPHAAPVAIAVAAAVTVLAGFSYATSSMVARLESGPLDSTPAATTRSAGYVRTEKGVSPMWRAMAARGVEALSVDVVFDTDSSVPVRVFVPMGRPAQICFPDTGPEGPVQFETIDAASRYDAVEGAWIVDVPPLDRGAYPFATATGSRGGVLVVE